MKIENLELPNIGIFPRHHLEKKRVLLQDHLSECPESVQTQIRLSIFYIL